ncbi:unnamed protein product [Mucor hiemalis]
MTIESNITDNKKQQLSYEQDWISPFNHACKVIISDIPSEADTTKTPTIPIVVTPKLNELPDITTKCYNRNRNLIRAWNIPRSNSLDNNYFTQYYQQRSKLSKKDDSYIKSDQQFNTASSYNIYLLPKYLHHVDANEEGYEEDDDDISKASVLSRSYSYGTKIMNNRELLSTTTNSNWKLANTTGSDIYPDMTHTSRKAPTLGHEIRIPNQYGTIHALTVRGSTIIICTSHYAIKSFLIQDVAEQLCSSPIVPNVPSSESIISMVSASSRSSTSSTGPRKNSVSSEVLLSVCFSPAFHPNDDNKIVWAGTENGSIIAIDAQTDEVIVKRMATHSHPITFILRHRNTELWTIDNGGNLNIWSVIKKTTTKNSNEEDTTASTTINLLESSPQRYLVCANIKTAILSPKKSVLWCSSGRSIDLLDRSEKEAIPLIHIPSDFGDITRLVLIPFHADQIFCLHSDGRMTAWNILSLEKIKAFVISADKITSVSSVGEYHLWIGYHNGSIAIYDTRSEPWVVVKIWKAHSNPVTKLEVDDFSIIEGMSVVSVDSAGHLAIWDGLLADDWFEQQMLAKIPDYSTSEDAKIMICSWNMNAVKPDALTDWDIEKLHEWLNGITDPDVIIIGAQEIIDLANKTMTAKSFLLLGSTNNISNSGRKSDSVKDSEEALKNRYKLWNDYFISIIDENFGEGKYKVVKTAQLVGLFSCVIVKATDELRVNQCDSTVVKTGFRVMTKGLHGNKGGIATRLVINDTSLCFVNCHFASGQNHVVQRNADMEGVISTAKFPVIDTCDSTVFNRDTDGSNILDHQVCFVSGDLNYRINMQREQVLDLLSRPSSNKFETWEALQNEDQFKKQQIMNPLFRLFNFKEAPILFDPTYKYDRESDLYDSSEKKRIPAWCDRVLYRAPSTLTNLYYRRHEVRASDHRPISAGFTIPIKSIIPEMKDQVRELVKQEWQANIISVLQANKVRYITNYDLCDENEAQSRLKTADWDVEKVVLDLYHDKGTFV